MSEFFAEATVQIRPDLRGFITALRAQVKTAVDTVEKGPEAQLRVRPALTVDFIGSLRTQANAAIEQANTKIQPIRVSAIIRPLTAKQVAAFIKAAEATAKTFPIAVGFTPFVPTGAPAPTGGTAAPPAGSGGAATTAARVRIGTKATTTAITQTKAELGLAAAQADVQLAQSALLREGQKLIRLRGVESRLLTNIQVAERERARAVGFTAAQAALRTQEESVRVLRDVQSQIQAEEASRARLRTETSAANKALRENARDATRSARSHEQLRRGVASTGLSFLGIRGATLAASASFLVGAASFAVLARAIQNSAQFADQINVFRATAGATSEELDRVRESARALGSDLSLPGVTATDAATAMVELAKAGLDVQQSIDGARGVLQLATAAAISNEQAVELAANALNAFGLQGRDATRVADTFANAANAAQGSIVDIGTAFQQAAAAGRQVGLTFEDTTTFLTILQREGIRGSDAGTSLRTALIRLIRPTEAARDRLRQLGIEVRDASGNLRADIFQQIAGALRDLPPAARDATIALIGGQDAFRAISILGRQSIDEFIGLRRELRQQGTAGELAAARMEGLRGSVEGLGNTLSTAGGRIGQGLTPALQSVVVGITSGAAAMGESEQVARAFSGSVEALELSISALGATLNLIGPPLVIVASAFEQVTNAVGVPVILAALAAFKLYPLVFGRATAAVTGLAAAQTRLATTFRLLRDPGITGKLAFLTGGMAGAAAAAAAALVLLSTRESEAERVTRRLTEATDQLARSLDSARQAQRQSAELSLGVNSAQLAVIEARQAAANTRAELSTSRAGRGSFERTKLELELRVALDNVAIAQERYRRAIEDSSAAQDAARQATQNVKNEQEELIGTLIELTERQRDLGALAAGGRADIRAAEAFAVAVGTRELRERIDVLREENTVASRSLANRLSLLEKVSGALGRIPTERAVRIAIETEDADTALQRLAREFDVTGEALSALENIVRGESARQLGFAIRDLATGVRTLFRDFMGRAGADGGDAFTRAAANAINAGSENVTSAVRNVMDRARAQISGIERERLDLEIAGAGDAAILANLQQQATVEQGILDRARAKQRAGKTSFEPVRAAQEDLNQTLSQIRAIQGQMAADVKSAADDARQQREERDQDLLDLLGLGRDRAQERIQDAQLTEGLGDDIRFTIKLRRLVRTQIATVEEQIRTASLRIKATRELRAINRELGRELRRLQQENRDALRERAAERNQLDIEFAQINENRTAEIRARQREIARLKKLQDDTKRGTLEYRRLRNLIAEQERAIKELKDQQKEKNDSLQQLAFEFLQTQQGFAANLISNLIPGDALGGLVGGQSALGGRTPISEGGPLTQPVTSLPGLKGFGGGLATALVRERRVDEATHRVPGVTSGQGNTQIDLLRRILVEVTKANRSSDHPEAKQQRKTGATALDYGGGGGGSMAM